MTLKDSSLKRQGRHSDTNTCNSGACQLVHFEAREQIFLCYAFLYSFVCIFFIFKGIRHRVPQEPGDNNNSRFHAGILVTGSVWRMETEQCVYIVMSKCHYYQSSIYIRFRLYSDLCTDTHCEHQRPPCCCKHTHGFWSHQRWVIIHHFAVSQSNLYLNNADLHWT